MRTNSPVTAAMTRFKKHFGQKVPGKSLRELSSKQLIAAVDKSIAANEISELLKGEETDLVGAVPTG